MPHLVLFVCTGNVCRSPMAAAFFNDHARRAGEGGQFEARSVGTWANDMQPASGYAINVMAHRGLDLSAHRARTIKGQDLAGAHVILVMTRNHQQALAAEFPQYRGKLHLLSETKGLGFDIGDPYGGSLSDYQNCAEEIQDFIETGYEQIKQWTRTDPT